MSVMIKCVWWIWTLMENGLYPKEVTKETSEIECTVEHCLNPKIVQQRPIQLQNNSPSSLPQATKKKCGRLRWDFWLNITWFLGNKAPKIQMVSSDCHLGPPSVRLSRNSIKKTHLISLMNDKWSLQEVKALHSEKAGPRLELLPQFFLKCALQLCWLTWAYKVQFTEVTLLDFWRLNSLNFKHLSLASICSCQYLKLPSAALMPDTQRGPLKDSLMVPLNKKCLFVLLPCIILCML